MAPPVVMLYAALERVHTRSSSTLAGCSMTLLTVTSPDAAAGAGLQVDQSHLLCCLVV